MNRDVNSDPHDPASRDGLSLSYVWIALVICSWALILYLAALIYAALE